MMEQSLQLELGFSREFVVNRPVERSGQVSLLLVRNARSRRYIIRVLNERCVRVTIPRGGTLRGGKAFFDDQHRWVSDQLDRMERQRARESPLWKPGARIWIRGKKESIRWDRNGAGIRVRLGEIELKFDQWELDMRAQIEGGLRGIARQELHVCVDRLANQVGLKPKGITVRGQRTRWGSCSSSGGLSLNWRLLQVPLAVRDYVIIHELCHLRHLNHSPRFWQLVRRHCPRYREHETWLRRHGDQIIRR